MLFQLPKIDGVRQDTEEEICPPCHPLQKDIEVKRTSIQPHAHKDAREKINSKLMTDIIT